MLSQLKNIGTSYNIKNVYKIKGNFDVKKAEECFKELIQRHESLRSYFGIVDGEIMQFVEDYISFSIFYSEIYSMSDGETVKNFSCEFDLGCAPLLRVGVWKQGVNDYLLVFDIHHLISDGESNRLLWYEFSKLYRNESMEIPTFQFRDCISIHDKMLTVDRMIRQENYWLETFKDDIPKLNLITDKSRPPVQTFAGRKTFFTIDKALLDKIKKFTNENGMTLYVVMFSCFNILLAKHAGQEQIVVGAPLTGRNYEGSEKAIGMFVNTVAILCAPQNNVSVKRFMELVRSNIIKALDNQDYPFEKLVDKVVNEHDASRNPLFDVMFAFNYFDKFGFKIEGTEIRPLNIDFEISQFDLLLQAEENENSIDMHFEYNTELFFGETIQRMGAHFIHILEEVIEDSSKLIQDINMLSKTEMDLILKSFNRSYEGFCDGTIHGTFEKRAIANPKKTALVFDGAEMSYEELNRRSDIVASALSEKGIGTGEKVSIMLERSFEMVIGILGILKSGAAYLPIDPDYPEARIRFIISDSNSKVMLVNSSMVPKASSFGIDCICLNENQMYLENTQIVKRIYNPRDLAYVLYTSGSTGRPKGVMIEHRSVVNLLSWLEKQYPQEDSDAYLLKTAYTFDVSVCELFGWFFGTGRLVILKPSDHTSPNSIVEALLKYNITHIQFVPSMLDAFISAKDIGMVNSESKLKYVLVAGEVLSENLVRRFYDRVKNVRLENLYGPTECCVYSTAYSTNKYNINKNISIGKPLPNYSIYILDRNKMLQGIGIPGEIYIAGFGVACGYMNRNDLTEEKFESNPFLPKDRMYRTGDSGRWLSDGNIEFLARLDDQVKLHGYRIELSEIENLLLAHPTISEAVVLLIDDLRGNHLCAYVVPDSDVTASSLQKYLAELLPAYMIPREFVKLGNLPLLPNGKIDKVSLRNMPVEAPLGHNHLMPRNSVEEGLRNIWIGLLGIADLFVNDNFFELGGNSLSSIKMALAIEKIFCVRLSLDDIFANPTIELLAQLVGIDTQDNSLSEEPISADHDDNNTWEINEDNANLCYIISYRAVCEQNKNAVQNFDMIDYYVSGKIDECLSLKAVDEIYLHELKMHLFSLFSKEVKGRRKIVSYSVGVTTGELCKNGYLEKGSMLFASITFRKSGLSRSFDETIRLLYEEQGVLRARVEKMDGE
jgi:amino acid adenylation domain-containing protein